MEGRVCDFETAVGAFEDSISTFQGSVQLFGLLLAKRAELESMCVGNAQRAFQGDAMMYAAEDVCAIATDIQELLEKFSDSS